VPDEKNHKQLSRSILITIGKKYFLSEYWRMLQKKMFTGYRRYTKYRERNRDDSWWI